MTTALQKIGKFNLFFILLPIPILWALFSQLSYFETYFKPLSNLAMDWRYQVRGPIDAPEVKVVYADVDAPAIAYLGERPWSRAKFATLGSILFEYGGAKAVGYDIVFSEFTASDMVPPENVKKADLELGAKVRAYPNIVLAANYTGVLLPYTLEERQVDLAEVIVDRKMSQTPIDYLNQFLPVDEQVLPENTFPEMPTFPVIGQTILTPMAQAALSEVSGYPFLGGSFGTVGLIVVDTALSGDTVPRWAPLYTESRGPYWTLNLLQGIDNFYDTVDSTTPELMGDDVIVLDSEGNFLTQLPYITEQRFYHFAIQLALKYLDLGEENISISDDFLSIQDNDGQTVIRIPLTHGQFTEVNWFSKWVDPERNPRESLEAIFQQYHNLREGEGEIVEQAKQFFKKFEDAIVLIGPVDPTLQDVAPTPFDSSSVPKVSVHGNLLKTFFSDTYISRLSTGTNVAILFLLTFFVAILGLYSGRLSVQAKIGSFLLLGAYVVAVFLAFNTAHLVLPFIAPVASAITTTTAGALYQLFLEERQKSRIKGMFGTYLSPQLVNEMVESGEEPRLGGEDAEITALFSDVQSFSGFSELLEPAQLVLLMNEYLTAMTDILMEEGSYVDKYIGDAIVAMFNAPVHLQNHALRGCIAAARIQKRQLELRQKWAQEGEQWPDIVSQMQTRIGLNTGSATVGNMGSESRFNYTMMGDTVNLAARCESGAKSAGVYTMVAAETYSAASAAGDDILFRFVDKWQVKGRTEPVDMYEVVGLQEDLDDNARECVKLYEGALQLYFKQQWAEAITLFQKASKLEANQPGATPGVTTNPSLVLIERCNIYRDDGPGADWDGVYIMKTK